MSKAEKLFDKMKKTKHGWRPDDLHTLYTGFGFKYREGGNHTIYYHPDFPQFMRTVARHPSLVVGYIQVALRTIEKVKELKEKNHEKA